MIAGTRTVKLKRRRPAVRLPSRSPKRSGSVERSPDHGGELYAFSDGEPIVQELSIAPRRRERRYTAGRLPHSLGRQTPKEYLFRDRRRLLKPALPHTG